MATAGEIEIGTLTMCLHRHEEVLRETTIVLGGGGIDPLVHPTAVDPLPLVVVDTALGEETRALPTAEVVVGTEAFHRVAAVTMVVVAAVVLDRDLPPVLDTAPLVLAPLVESAAAVAVVGTTIGMAAWVDMMTTETGILDEVVAASPESPLVVLAVVVGAEAAAAVDGVPMDIATEDEAPKSIEVVDGMIVDIALRLYSCLCLLFPPVLFSEKNLSSQGKVQQVLVVGVETISS